jgi:Co/Zn/Cd efflux system component
MILSGMGPVDQMKTFGGKLFAGFYALYSGLALIAIVALVMAPVFRRFLHRFHLDEHRPD